MKTADSVKIMQTNLSKTILDSTIAPKHFGERIDGWIDGGGELILRNLSVQYSYMHTAKVHQHSPILDTI